MIAAMIGLPVLHRYQQERAKADVRHIMGFGGDCYPVGPERDHTFLPKPDFLCDHYLLQVEPLLCYFQFMQY